MGILSELRYVYGVDTGMRGLPASIRAPMLNILNLLDTELEVSAFEVSPELEKELTRFHQALVKWNDVDDSEEEDDSPLIELDDETDNILETVRSAYDANGYVIEDDITDDDDDDDDDWK